LPDIKPDKDTLTGQNAGKVSFGHRIAPLIILLLPLIILLLMILVMAYILAINWAPEVIDVIFVFLFWPIAAIGLIIWSSIILMKKKQIFGCILLFSSAAVCFISIFISGSIFDAYSKIKIDHQDPSSMGFYMFFLQVVSLVVIFLIPGIIMFFTGKSQAKKQKNQNT
jgi:hypothetical protein